MEGILMTFKDWKLTGEVADSSWKRRIKLTAGSSFPPKERR